MTRRKIYLLFGKYFVVERLIVERKSKEEVVLLVTRLICVLLWWYICNSKKARFLIFWKGKRVNLREVSFLPLLLPPLSFFGSCFISRAAETENPVPRLFFAPKPNRNACYAGYFCLGQNHGHYNLQCLLHVYGMFKSEVNIGQGLDATSRIYCKAKRYDQLFCFRPYKVSP